MILRSAMNATVKSPIDDKESSVRNVRVGSMQNAKLLMINFTRK